mmetsp:Transcript_24867/g.72871  ORF Transcript_24867/g.72871 Transcript_24867/m.72871 type:complete len:83 (-) Transcript_24867:791-1039(-)
MYNNNKRPRRKETHNHHQPHQQPHKMKMKMRRRDHRLADHANAQTQMFDEDPETESGTDGRRTHAAQVTGFLLSPQSPRTRT